MMPEPRHVAIVGASLAGVRVASGLRAEGFAGRLTVIGAELHAPYDRPPLSKQILTGSWKPEQATLPFNAHELDVDLLLGRRAIALDRGKQAILLEDREEVRAEIVVLATGAHPKSLRVDSKLEGVHALRTIDDALDILAAFRQGARVVVVGGGFIGAEVAASARSYGLNVTVVEYMPVPMGAALGTTLGKLCQHIHADHGVNFRCGTGIVGMRGTRRVEEVLLSDGSVLPADVVIVGVGVSPTAGWLCTSGLMIEDGVVCSASGAADRSGTIFAVGDVARWFSLASGAHVRAQHWSSACEQAQHVARRITGKLPQNSALVGVPYFWSDQYDTKIQMVGIARPDATIDVVHGSIESRRFVATFSLDGRLIGAVAFNAPRHLVPYRQELGKQSAPHGHQQYGVPEELV